MDKMVRALWPKEARPIAVKLEDVGGLIAMPKVFSTGSVGWYANGKVSISDTPVQVNIVITVIGSKNVEDQALAVTEQDVTPPKFKQGEAPGLQEPHKGSVPNQRGRKGS